MMTATNMRGIVALLAPLACFLLLQCVGSASGDGVLTWEIWNRVHSCRPRAFERPESEADVVDLVRV